jgi:hypothetical protein
MTETQKRIKELKRSLPGLKEKVESRRKEAGK